MTAALSTDAWTYDDFTGLELDPARWAIMSIAGADGTTHQYQDRNAQVRTGDGRLELSVNPFSRFHDTDPRQNNAKQMYRSVRRFATPVAGRLTFEVEMGIRTYGQVPYDPLDAFGTVNLFDLATGVVLNAAATNDTLYAVVERLALPGVTSPDEHYIHRVVLNVPTEPGLPHRYAISYLAGAPEVEFRVDGLLAYWTRLPVPVSGFHAGMALFSARDLTRYPRSQRERGQGASGWWGPWRITTRFR
ncbi:hypothetical protein DFJ67_7052 [Asanoa ferruginea]|uniref:PE-PGRS family protein n=1 Tax=Asanoa ferruginea TaxID=53367 RepID=A0A3E0A3T8_9ACTN|nr:DUF6081 family protein [Asanoa ferruginea]REG00981.1 hypothetical protein DFJ67_7052 [Asanoa ferruginea]GIF47581.1 hypothetical protein Afe04nite_21200 [Asanoa ferruginea]